jgi:two-component system, OmpR family, sensor histidine kinase MprB
MSFRLRLTVLASLAVAVAIVGTSFVVYVTDRSELFNQVDDNLRASTTVPPFAALFAQPPTAVKVLTLSGGRPATFKVGSFVVRKTQTVVLPKTQTAVQVRLRAGSGELAVRNTRFASTRIGGVHSRVLTMSVGNLAVEISQSLVEVDRNLAHLRLLLGVVSLGGIVVAAVLGALVSGRAVAPLRRLTETTEQIVDTGDLSRRTGQRGRDEISRLSARLDELLATLETSLAAQRQLVADASHELRTPIATLRANVELLAEPGALDAAERAELVTDVRGELESMTSLVGELVELARGEEHDLPATTLRLDDLVRSVVERAMRRAPRVPYRMHLEPSTVVGIPERIERAVANLVENAGKWSPPGGAVDVSVSGGQVEVRDRGPGIAAEDLPLVFNRFYRSAGARGTPGAGLGLAIVKQVAEAHGGAVSAEAAPGGGALLRFRLPPAPVHRVVSSSLEPF